MGLKPSESTDRATIVATFDAMARTRVSTTVDAERLKRARQIVGGRDSELLDQALAWLIERDDRRREIEALEASPYHLDDELEIGAPEIDWDSDLPYEGSVPVDVAQLARKRRQEAS